MNEVQQNNILLLSHWGQEYANCISYSGVRHCPKGISSITLN